jgi:glycosyltransferase involved in cell wall biosynthesis
MINELYPGRVGLQQRVVPSYRGVFFDTLASACQGGLSVFAGKPLPNEEIESVKTLQVAQLENGTNRYLFNPGSSFFICWQTNILSWLENYQPDVLVVEANPRYFSTPSAIDWMHRKGKKVIGWGLGAPPLTGLLGGYRRWQRSRLLHSLDAIIAYSQLGADQYREAGFRPEQVYVATNAVSLAPAGSPPTRPFSPDEKVSLLFVGRLQARKRVDLLIKACAALSSEFQPDLVIVGDGSARNDLQDLAARVYPSTEFTGAMHGEELEPYYQKADLFVLPGTGGLAVQQAMAHALPVIVAQGDGTQDDLVRSDNGWQVSPDDLPQLTSTLQMALSDKARLRQMGENSFRIVAEEINVNSMVRVFIQALNNLS